MKRDIKARLKALETRRSGSLGTYSPESYGMDSADHALQKNLVEAYVKRGGEKLFTQWVLGAMQAVGKAYTNVSIKEGERVGDELKTALAKKGVKVDFKLQGSVPCDIHIRGTSDVDVLIIIEKFLIYSPTGVRAQRGEYTNPVTYDTLQSLVDLRQEAEKILQSAFSDSEVNVKNPKAIALSGGSLLRNVDAVPANWYDSDMYQATGKSEDRGIQILNKALRQRITNFPFKHIEQLRVADERSEGGLKKAIRLLKSIKANSEEEGEKIKLTSYDIASFMWHANSERLKAGSGEELKLLAEISAFMSYLLNNKDFAKELKTPNGHDTIFNDDSKFEGLTDLSNALNELAVSVALENPATAVLANVSINQVMDGLKRVFIPE